MKEGQSVIFFADNYKWKIESEESQLVYLIFLDLIYQYYDELEVFIKMVRIE